MDMPHNPRYEQMESFIGYSALIDELIDSAPSQKINSKNGMDLIGSGHDTHCDIVAKWKKQQKEGEMSEFVSIDERYASELKKANIEIERLKKIIEGLECEIKKADPDVTALSCPSYFSHSSSYCDICKAKLKAKKEKGKE